MGDEKGVVMFQTELNLVDRERRIRRNGGARPLMAAWSSLGTTVGAREGRARAAREGVAPAVVAGRSAASRWGGAAMGRRWWPTEIHVQEEATGGRRLKRRENQR